MCVCVYVYTLQLYTFIIEAARGILTYAEVIFDAFYECVRVRGRERDSAWL